MDGGRKGRFSVRSRSFSWAGGGRSSSKNTQAVLGQLVLVQIVRGQLASSSLPGDLDRASPTLDEYRTRRRGRCAIGERRRSWRASSCPAARRPGSRRRAPAPRGSSPDASFTETGLIGGAERTEGDRGADPLACRPRSGPAASAGDKFPPASPRDPARETQLTGYGARPSKASGWWNRPNPPA